MGDEQQIIAGKSLKELTNSKYIALSFPSILIEDTRFLVDEMRD
jgi:hypothetical protein